MDVQPGDYVDVRMIAVGRTPDGDLVVRLPGTRAIHQFAVGVHQVRHTEPRSPEAIAADVVCSSYPMP